jgi:serine/threonine-protein kinase
MVEEESVGGVFAGYRIEGLIRHGGMATVYRAHHLVLQRPAALKVLAPALARDQRFRARFLGESRAAASLDHPHIVPIYDAGEADGVLYIAMRLIEGSDLRALLAAEARLQPARAVELLAQVASALDAAHARGLVHRDVKPSNILIGAPIGSPPTEHAYLADFGITKALAAEAMTATSEFLGTIDYMSPEQIEGLPLDGRADVYSLGCVLHECLTGMTPFSADSVVGVMHAHLTKPPPRPSIVDPTLPEGLDAVVAKAMAKSPEDRHPTCTALVEAARATLEAPRRAAAPVFVPSVAATAGPRPRRRLRRPLGGWPRRWQALLAAVAAAVLLGVVAASTLRGSSGSPVAPSGPQTGEAPGVVLTPLPLNGVTATPAPSPGASSGAATPRTSSRGVTVVTVTAPPTPTARGTAAATRPGVAPTVTAGPPSPTAAGTATAAPPSSTPSPASTWPAQPATNTTPGCEPKWSWSCMPPGKCGSVVFYADSGTLPASPDTKQFTVTVGNDGSLCARWSNPGVQGALLGPDGKVVNGTSGANAGFLISNLPPGTYKVALHHADASTPDHTMLQINT